MPHQRDLHWTSNLCQHFVFALKWFIKWHTGVQNWFCTKFQFWMNCFLRVVSETAFPVFEGHQFCTILYWKTDPNLRHRWSILTRMTFSEMPVFSHLILAVLRFKVVWHDFQNPDVNILMITLRRMKVNDCADEVDVTGQWFIPSQSCVEDVTVSKWLFCIEKFWVKTVQYISVIQV